MEHEYQIEGVRMTYRMPKEVDHHQAKELTNTVDRLIEMHQIRELVFDFSDTEFMDSSGIGVIIGRSRKLGFLNGSVAAVHLNEQMDRIFLASGLNRIINIREVSENGR